MFECFSLSAMLVTIMVTIHNMNMMLIPTSFKLLINQAMSGIITEVILATLVIEKIVF